MDYKKFLKPTISKIVVFLVLFVLSHLLFAFLFLCYGGPCPTGFPFESVVLPGSAISDPEIGAVSWGFRIISFWGFIGNIIFWYLIACLVVLGFNKIKKK